MNFHNLCIFSFLFFLSYCNNKLINSTYLKRFAKRYRIGIALIWGIPFIFGVWYAFGQAKGLYLNSAIDGPSMDNFIRCVLTIVTTFFMMGHALIKRNPSTRFQAYSRKDKKIDYVKTSEISNDLVATYPRVSILEDNVSMRLNDPIIDSSNFEKINQRIGLNSKSAQNIFCNCFYAGCVFKVRSFKYVGTQLEEIYTEYVTKDVSVEFSDFFKDYGAGWNQPNWDDSMKSKGPFELAVVWHSPYNIHITIRVEKLNNLE